MESPRRSELKKKGGKLFEIPKKAGDRLYFESAFPVYGSLAGRFYHQA